VPRSRVLSPIPVLLPHSCHIVRSFDPVISAADVLHIPLCEFFLHRRHATILLKARWVFQHFREGTVLLLHIAGVGLKLLQGWPGNPDILEDMNRYIL
jgi:hypothetical protein